MGHGWIKPHGQTYKTLTYVDPEGVAEPVASAEDTRRGNRQSFYWHRPSSLACPIQASKALALIGLAIK